MTPYPKYKPSGIEWIGEIPEEWEVKKLKYVSSLKSGESITSEVIKESEAYPVYGGNGLRGYFGDYTHDGDYILIGRQGALCGNINYGQNKFWASEHAVVVTIKGTSNYLWLGELLRAMNLNQYSVAAAQPGLSVDNLINLHIPVPSGTEQKKIADFIEDKTAAINTCITKKQNLIELLKEEKTAIINEAVTKGIDKKAKLKPSGIEWLGDVPEHWEVKRLKYCGHVKYGLGQPPKQKEDGLPLIRATNVFRGSIDSKDLIFVDPDDIPYERDPVLKENDIIVVRSGAYTADSAIIPKIYEGAITGYDMVFRARTVDAKFIAYCLLSNYVLNCQLIPESLRAAQPHLNREELNETLLIIPPAKEQEAIVLYLNNGINKIETAIATIKKEIELMQEYRTALISEVVTGKVKV